MRKSVGSFIALNRNLIIVLAVILGVAASGFVAWQASASGNKTKMSESERKEKRLLEANPSANAPRGPRQQDNIRGMYRGVQTATHFDVSPPLRTLTGSPVGKLSKFREFEERSTGNEGALGPQDIDKTVQMLVGGEGLNVMPTPIVSFDSTIGCGGCQPPDPNGDVGPNHFVAMGNTQFQIFNKTGTSLLGPTNSNALWAGFGGPCQTENAGDPVVLHDQLDDRWILTQFTAAGPTFFNCVAISTSPDPTGTYFRYAFTTGSNFPDYPKYGMWNDALYISTREFAGASFAGVGAYAVNRAQLVAGNPAAQLISFLASPAGAGGAFNVGDGLVPTDLDGAQLPPAGSPNYFLGSMDQGGPYGAPQDALTLWKFTANFVTPASSSFVLANTIPIAAFDTVPAFCAGRSCIPQPGTGNLIDHLGYRQRPLFRAAYRNFGSHQSIVTNQSVEASPTMSGIRWWEVRSPNSSPVIHQEGTYAPGLTDGIHRWMGAIAMDTVGNMALGFSASSATTTFPSSWYTGRFASDPLGTMPQGEASVVNGAGSQTGGQRWGDYTDMVVDPVDDCTFWYTNEYIPAGGQWRMRVGSFKFPNCSLGPNFSLAVTPASQSVCAPANAVYTVNTTSISGFVDPVTLSATGNPAGTTVTFSPNPVIPGGSSTMTVSNTGAAAPGLSTINVLGTSGALTQNQNVALTIASGTPAAPTLTSPANGSTAGSLSPTFTWAAATGAATYEIQVATDAAFTNVVASATGLAVTSFTPASPLASNTPYFWRVRAVNACATGAYSTVFSFTTPCISGYLPTTQTGQTIPAGGTFIPLSDDDDFVVAIPLPSGWSSTVYGLAVTSLSASTNGNMRVNGAAATTFTNTALPAAQGATNPTLHPYWDDLDMDVADVTGGGIFTNTIGSAPNRQFYVEWRAQHFAETVNGPITTNFAILLTEGSDVVRYIYALTGIGAQLNGASATVGVQREQTGTNFSQFSFNTASLSAGMQITYAAPGCGTPTATSTGSPATATATSTATNTNTATATATASPAPGGCSFSNGGLNPQMLTESGVAAPAGFFWSEVQHDVGNTTESNTVAGFGAIQGANRLADNFTISQQCTIDSLVFYGYLTGGGAASPFTAYTLQIWNGRPGDPGSAVVFGDTTTNRLATSVDSTYFRIFNTAVPPPGTVQGTTRKIWRNTLNVGTVLAPGTYWVDWASTVTGAANHFHPSKTIQGSRGAAGDNARQQTVATMAWIDVIDAGNPATAPDVPQDFPFDVVGTGGGTATATATASPSPTFTGTPTNTATATPTASPCVAGYQSTTQTGQTIPAGGTFVPLSDDDDFVVGIPLPSGWSSTVYGLSVTSLSAGTNGHMTVNGAASTTFTNTAMPGAIGGTNPTLLPYWDDLDMDVADVTGGGIFTNTIGSAPNRQFYVEWRAQHFSETVNGPITTNFAILLTEGSDVVRYIYALTGIGAQLDGASATVGVQRQATGTNFSQFSFNTASLSAGMQITYTATGCGTPSATPTATATSTPGGTPPATSVQFGSAAYSEDESQTAAINITRTGDTTGTTTVNFATSNGTATGGAACGSSGVDYVSVAQAVTFAPNVTSQTVNVTICGDTLVEPTQTVNMTLTGASVGSPGTAVLSIIDTASLYRSTGSICTTFGGPGSPYPATVTVANGPPAIGSIRVTLFDVAHTIPDSMDFLLVGPTGQKFILMADAGGVIDLVNPVTLTFSDTAGQVLPNGGPLTTGLFEPTNWEPGQTSFAAPAPAAPYNEPGSTVGGAGTQTLLGNFGATNSNGVWSLFMRDDAGALTNAITGCVNGGWGLEVLGATAANASISGRVTTADGRGIRNANVVIMGNSLVQPIVVTTGSFGYFSFDGLATGETYVVTVNSRRYTFTTPSRVISLVDNVVDADFIADPQE